MTTKELSARIEKARSNGQEIIAVLGLGFVGTAVVANLARTADKSGKRLFFVIGIDQDTPLGNERTSRLNQGLAPVYANDEKLEAVISESHAKYRNLAGTVDTDALGEADTVICCINLDLERTTGQTEKLAMNTAGYAAAMKLIGSKVRPGTLVTVESTLPLGMCDKVLYPALLEGQREQGINVDKNPPLLAFCYERVMPGPDYLDSVNNFWRAYAGVNAESNTRARAFLSKFVNTAEYPLWEHKTTRAAEMSKLLENSYRALNIAFIEEWSKLAEDAGVDLFDVINSVRVRRGTHDNMMRPGLGVGGYCLTKDALLAAYGAEQLLKLKAELPFSRRAILTNEQMPLRAVEWIRGHCRGDLTGKKAALLGVTYRPGVADTRSSATEIVARELVREGATVVAYDPLVDRWDEFPEIEILSDPTAAVSGATIVVICLPDFGYKRFLNEVLATLPGGSIVIDPWDMVGDELAAKLKQKNVALRVYGRGDIGSRSSELRQ